MSESNKRHAQSPLSGDEDDLKRRIIMDDSPILVSLADISEEDNESTENSELGKLLGNGAGDGLDANRSAAEKVDNLITRMDKFMECFAGLHSIVSTNQNVNTRKFKRLEEVHNKLATKVSDTTNSMTGRLDSLETKLKESQSLNANLADKIKKLEEDQIHRTKLQTQLEEGNVRKFIALEEELGVTNKTVHDCSSEIKERKLIIAGVPESPDEDVSKTALDNINRVIEAAIAMKQPDQNLGGLRKLHRGSIDNVYRLGKTPKGPYSRNIAVTFLRFDDKDMVIRAKSDIKGDADLKIFFNEDVSAEGRVLKTQLRRIAQVAKSQGKIAKVSGNKVTIESRSYYSNQLSLIPPDVADNLKHEKHIDDGIIYKGEKSIFSNFYPAPFSLHGTDFHHVEQYYQHCKAIHHNEIQTADRIMRMSNPRRIKTLGDSIESNSTWLEQRMMALYRGTKAKFEQNWLLQDDLVSSQGKQLYEATTDMYFGCGISFESPRWSRRDWPGENVAGLIVMKVREEIIGLQPVERPSNSTLPDPTTDVNLDSSVIMDTNDNSVLEPRTLNTDVKNSTVGNRASAVQQPSQRNNREVDRRHNSRNSYVQTRSSNSTDKQVDCSIYELDDTPYGSQSLSQPRGYNRRGRNRGRGRGRGQNFRGNNSRGNSSYQRYPSAKPRNQQSKMNNSDRNFLCGDSSYVNNRYNTARSSSPKNRDIANPLGLSEQQMKGLALLGLNLPPGQSARV